MQECNEYQALQERGGGDYSAGHRRMYEAGLVLLDQSTASVLDVGAGIGWGVKRARELGFLGKWEGIEPCVDSFNHLVRTYPRETWTCCGLMEATVEPADYVFCIEVIEHLDKPDVFAFLKRIRSLCGKGLWLSTPESDRHSHGTLKRVEVVSLLNMAGFANVVVNGEQWTTLYICQ
jgi:2-polyprenyl-3-methyl-5-hydroxy-6-metoxy-1,4-benzoquinol methylase